jgi:hypothetical protein
MIKYDAGSNKINKINKIKIQILFDIYNSYYVDSYYIIYF